MPELAEVEYFRKQWEAGCHGRIARVHVHPDKRIFRGSPVDEMVQRVTGALLMSAEANGKQLLFRFSRSLWLGVHLGMSGRLLVGSADFQPGRHDHLVLYQRCRSLIFNDPRLFGRIRFCASSSPPEWWSGLPVPVNSRLFTRPVMERFLARHPRLPIKAALLLQSGFPGIGNWMADEILWRARIKPSRGVRELKQAELAGLWRSLQFVCRGAVRHVSREFGDPPENWLFHERWGRGGKCPIHRTSLAHDVIGGRSTAWCAKCQH